MSDLEIQETERKKKFLKRYRKTIAQINRLEYKAKNLNIRMTSLKSPGFSDMPRGGTPITYEDLVIEKSEIEDRIKRLKVKAKKIKPEITDLIDELDNTRYAEVLEAFLIECKDFNTIAEENNYSVRHVERLYGDAIRSMSF